MPTAPDREAKYQSGAGKYFHHDKDGKRVLELSYEKASEYSDGRGLYEKVHAKFVQGHEIFGGRVETKSPPADGEMPRNLEFRGNVKVVDKGGGHSYDRPGVVRRRHGNRHDAERGDVHARADVGEGARRPTTIAIRNFCSFWIRPA